MFKVVNRVDRNIYCIKMVKLSRKGNSDNMVMKREIDIQSRLQNQHIVRYYNAWVEHLTDPEIIAELDFEDSDESEEEMGAMWEACKGFHDSSVLINSSNPTEYGLGAAPFGSLNASGSRKPVAVRDRFYSESSVLIPTSRESSDNMQSSVAGTSGKAEPVGLENSASPGSERKSESRALKRYVRESAQK